MSYITKEQVAAIRAELKTAFPEIKFSVIREHYSKLSVSIMQANIKFVDEDYRQLNYYYSEDYQNSDVLKKIIAICNRDNYDRSDIQTDYFEVGYYFGLSVGKYDKPFVLKEETKPVSKIQPKPAKKSSFYSNILNFFTPTQSAS